MVGSQSNRLQTSEQYEIHDVTRHLHDAPAKHYKIARAQSRAHSSLCAHAAHFAYYHYTINKVNKPRFFIFFVLRVAYDQCQNAEKYISRDGLPSGVDAPKS